MATLAKRVVNVLEKTYGMPSWVTHVEIKDGLEIRVFSGSRLYADLYVPCTVMEWYPEVQMDVNQLWKEKCVDCVRLLVGTQPVTIINRNKLQIGDRTYCVPDTRLLFCICNFCTQEI